MDNPRLKLLCRDALSGRLNRRQVLEAGLGLGLATPILTTLMQAAPEAAAAPQPSARTQRSLTQSDPTTLNILITSGTNDVDPHSTYTTLGSVVSLGVYEMLIQYQGESTSEYSPMLAESWEASADNSTFTFKIPAGVKFQDGTDCNADAVKQSFIRFRRMERGPYAVISRFCDDPENMIEVVDPTTIRFNLGQAQPLFLAAMASSYGPYVVSPKAWADHKTNDDEWAHEWLSFNAVGTGPYRLTENNPNDQIVMERYDEFHGGWDGNHFDKIIFRVVPEDATRRQLLEQGEADAATFNLTPDDVEALKTEPAVQVLVYPSTRVNWAIMNVPRLKTKEVRQGFSYAFPYDDVMNGAYKGLLKRSGPIPDTVKDADPNVFLYQTDLDKAKSLILSGGFKEGDEFDYNFTSGDEVERVVAQLFQANVQKMGFKLTVTEIDGAAYNDLIYGDAPTEEKPTFMGAWAWWPDYNDPWNQLYPNFTKAAIGSGLSNGGGYVNDRFEEIMGQAEHYTDENTLTDLMKEAQNILTELDPPAIYYGEVQYYTILGKDIQGFYANPLYLEAYPLHAMSRAQA
jgi:peptide/nickel transport system substrate-binding protein